jgi:LruC domain-containing protein
VKNIKYIAGILLTVLFACDRSGEIPVEDIGFKGIVVPDGFEYATTRHVTLRVKVKNTFENLPGVPVMLYLDNPIINDSLNPGARFLKTLDSDLNGEIDTRITIPAMEDSIFLYTEFIGLEQVAPVNIVGAAAEYRYGETSETLPLMFQGTYTAHLKSGSIYSYMGTWNAIGTPDYLASPNDIISAAFLNDLNSSLPEKISVQTSHPSYLADGNEPNLKLTADADVWVTFVHEGAGFLNSLGYYTYQSGTSPTSISQIKKHTIIFPNVDYVRYGGALVSGNKVFLGRFPAGTSIGFFLIQGGFTSGTIQQKLTFYSDKALNAETVASLKQHTVLLNDLQRKLLLLGFEDLSRQANCDNDFNDAVFYVTANPPTAINTDNLPPVDSPYDRDKDGVVDYSDKYPDDPEKAYDYFYPDKGQYGSLVAEDLWPSYGDFDFNDLVTDYHFHLIANGQNKVVEMNIKLKVRAIGASFKNGLGFELPVSPDVIGSVIGQNLPDGLFKLSANGTETGQSKAVIIAFENAFDLLPHPGGGTGVNVKPGSIRVESKEMTVTIVFSTPVPEKELSNAPFNPFLIINGNRGKEIHLAGYQPTSLADNSYFGQGQDNTSPTSSRFYLSIDNYPWMLNLPVSFEYPVEKDDIVQAYKHLGTWASSGGTMFSDWYQNIEGYQDKTKIFR